MNTARDLFVITLEVPSSRPIAQGDVSLVLAGAELVDLRDAHVLRLDGDRIVPLDDHADGTNTLTAQASAQLVTEPPYETVEQWLWRRGRGLAGSYADDLAAQTAGDARGGLLPRFLRPFATNRSQEPSVRPRHEATDPHQGLDDSVLAAFAGTLGIGEAAPPPPTEPTEPTDTTTVDQADDIGLILAVVSDALTELEAERQRRQIEQDAYDNVWRAP
ncbi:GPP34 family phosphoprotein [Streptomyces sp. b94]|uniref:GPP34 family phosphoprotein n=1 Tax=Streptomyces sp. b94 TaxID=1827634 RepID=UPI001B38CA5E|nr:GPP34 family phosphoprotein [Streptomyces sp. b94]MBQ1095382.1 GPP34 family phosphoprotein [Streptomyces sp. b94]